MASPRPSRRRVPAIALWLGLAALACLVVAAPATAAPAPGESCPDQTPAPGASGVVCEDRGLPPDAGGGTGGTDLSSLLPIVGAIVVAGGLALVGAFVLIRRRTGGPVAPADPGEWWTCRKCGAHNVLGSARCYSCGTWQG